MSTTPRDYDSDPGRYRLGMQLSASYTTSGADLHARIVDLLAGAGVRRVLDVGCGDGALAVAAAASPVKVISADAADAMACAASRHGPAVRADLTALPVADASMDAVVAVNVLDHLAEPARGLHEVRRVLRPAGLFVAGTISRTDSPELAPLWQPASTPFDSEDAPALVAATIGPVDVQPWDAPLVTLPGRDALRDYLVARFVPAGAAETLADTLAARVRWPLSITKRGALVIARRPCVIGS